MGPLPESMFKAILQSGPPFETCQICTFPLGFRPKLSASINFPIPKARDPVKQPHFAATERGQTRLPSSVGELLREKVAD